MTVSKDFIDSQLLPHISDSLSAEPISTNLSMNDLDIDKGDFYER